jgi:acyl dehydratase
MMPVYFDDIRAGKVFRSTDRLVSLSDIGQFADLTGDHNLLHTDDEWVRANTSYPSRIAHGLLVLSAAEGTHCEETDDWAIVAFLEVQRKMLQPVMPGDRIHQVYTVESTKPSVSKPGRGVVTVKVDVVNQDNVVVQTGKNVYMVGAAA